MATAIEALHRDEEPGWYDYRQTKFLKAGSFRMMRFNNSDVLKFPVPTVEQISNFMRRHAPPSVTP